MKRKLFITLTITGFLVSPLVLAASDYVEINVENGGIITGKVTFSGDDPPPKVYSITRDNQVCGEAPREIDYVKVKNGALNDAVVYLDQIKQGKAFPAEAGDVTIVQEACEFKPFMGVMRNDTKLTSINKDPVLHNIHTYEFLGTRKKTVLNISQPNQNAVTGHIKLRRSDGMKLECDQHEFMHAFIFVANNPYYAIVNEDGAYTIDQVPPGEYSIKAWHGTLKNQKTKIRVDAGGSATVDFEFK